MSVLIKGMEMPTSCTMCWLNSFCGVWNTEPVKHKGFNERLEGCPLTEQIQCKDCMWYNSDEYEADYGDCTNDMGMCNAFVYGNDYCSQAERRGEHDKTD